MTRSPQQRALFGGSVAHMNWPYSESTAPETNVRFCQPKARQQLTKERQNLAALQLTADDHVALYIGAMDLEDGLCDIEPDRRDRLHDPPPNQAAWHLRAGGGAVQASNAGIGSFPTAT